MNIATKPFTKTNIPSSDIACPSVQPPSVSVCVKITATLPTAVPRLSTLRITLPSRSPR